MKQKLIAGLILCAFLILTVFHFSGSVLAEDELLIFAGSASQLPTKEVAKAFEAETGVEVNLVFGGSGHVLSQMQLGKRGDIYFPGSSDYMEIAKRKKAVLPKTERIISYLVPAINVQQGNPKNIEGLNDLIKPGIDVAIANPEGVCVGTYAVEIIEKNFTSEEQEAFRENLVNYIGSCSKTATAISLQTVDAVIGWRVFEHWDSNKIETIPLKTSEISRIGYLPIAVAEYTSDKQLAKEFIDFMSSTRGKEIFRKYNYFMSAEEASNWITEEKPVGGEYAVPEEWIKE